MKMECLIVLATILNVMGVSAAESMAGRYLGVRDDEVVYTLDLTERGAACVKNGNSYERGRWQRKQIGKSDTLIVSMLSRDLVHLYLIDGNQQTLRLLGRGETLKEILEDRKAGVRPSDNCPNKILVKDEKPLPEEERREIDGVTARTVAHQKREREHTAVQDRLMELEEKQQDLLEMPLVYPEKMPKEIRELGDGYTQEMRALGEALAHAEVTYSEQQLIDFVERCDWSRGRYLIACAFSRKELGAETRRRYAEKFLAWLGEQDEIYLVSFIMSEWTPSDVVKRFNVEKMKDKRLIEIVKGRQK